MAIRWLLLVMICQSKSLIRGQLDAGKPGQLVFRVNPGGYFIG